jgi:hypothetical protein
MEFIIRDHCVTNQRELLKEINIINLELVQLRLYPEYPQAIKSGRALSIQNPKLLLNNQKSN